MGTKEYVVYKDENDTSSFKWFKTYLDAEAFANSEAAKIKDTVFIAEYVDKKKNAEYEDDEIPWRGYGFDENSNVIEMKSYILLVFNKITGKLEYRTDCIYSSVDDLKDFYKDFENIEITRAWESKEVSLTTKKYME